jgi:tRNA pseudouridine38-40 synthase
VARALGERPSIFAAGRTDAGVHALGQVVNFKSRSSLPLHEIRERLNDQLPKDVAVIRVDEVPESFHSRHDARERIYLYRITTRRSAFLKDLAWWVRSKLEIEPMKAAAALLVGHRDFAPFADKDMVPEDSVLTLFDIRIDRTGTLLELRFRAERFLPRMVRRLVGVLVAVGQGKLSPTAAGEIFDNPSQEVAEWTAPPQGLYLEGVLYDEKSSAAPAYRGGKGGAGKNEGSEILVWRP